MDTHTCEICSLQFSSKSNLNKHIKKYHTETKSETQEIPVKKNKSERLNELELQLKLQIMELKMKDLEIENLKLQISKLNVEKPRFKTPPRIPEFCLNTYLNETCKDSINFEDIWTEFIFNAEHNKWLLDVDNGKEEFNLLKYLNISLYPNGSNFYVDFFCESFNKIEQHKKPIFCSDPKRNVYYIKNSNEWTKIDYTELIKKIYNKINMFPIVLLNYIFSPNNKKITEKQFYQIYPDIKDFNDVRRDHYDKLVLNFCETTPENFLIKCNSALKKITSKNYTPYLPSVLDANDNELFKNEPDIESYNDE